MTASADGTDPGPGLVWPKSLTRPARPPELVYLDLNVFIYLARTAAGQQAPDGYLPLLAQARLAANSGQIQFVLSAVHYYEMAGIADPAQRASVAAMMEELTSFAVLLGRVTIAQLELDAALHALLGTDPASATDPVDIVGFGFGRAFGMRGGLLVRDPAGNDVTAELRAQLGAEEFDRSWRQANLQLERAMLAGPSDTQAAELRATSVYRPELTREGNERRAKQERDQAARLSAEPRWRTGRLRDVISAREVALEWLAQFNEAVGDRRDVVDAALMKDRATIRTFTESMPSSRVAITMKTRYHRNPQHAWSPNDISDIDAMAITVPYCDAVFTDKAARNALVSSHELDVFNTFLPRRPQELTDWLVAGSIPTTDIA